MRWRSPRFWWALGVLATLVLITVDAIARVGGGHTYGGGGGGGSSGGGGGGGGGGEGLARLIIWLIIEQPVIGVPLLIIVIAVFVMKSKSRGDVSVADGDDVVFAAHHEQRQSARQGLSAITEHDPAFSRFVFIDFMSLLYTRFQEGRGKPATGAIAAYLEPSILELAARNPVDVSNVVIGSLRIVGAGIHGDRARIAVQIESNMDEATPQVAKKRFYYRQRLVLEKRKDVPSPPPEGVRSLQCPNCGAAAELSVEGKCGYCGEIVNTGEFNWIVKELRTERRRPQQRLEVALGPGGDEPGVKLPTRFAPDYAAQKRALTARNPSFEWNAFRDHVRYVFGALQEAWSDLKWDRARPYETDHLFQTHRFWIERYQAEGLRNVLEDVNVLDIVPCRVERDAWYETVTCRIFASMRDFTVDAASGKVVGGNRSVARRFSEYWTFVRRTGAPDNLDKPHENCPSCGAPLNLSQSGVCNYCNAKVVTGDFGWTLALIEQDESYQP